MQRRVALHGAIVFIAFLFGASVAAAAEPADIAISGCIPVAADDGTSDIDRTPLGGGQPSQRQLEIRFDYRSRSTADDADLTGVAAATTSLDVCYAVSGSTAEVECVQVYPSATVPNVVVPPAPSAGNVVASTEFSSVATSLMVRVPYDYGTTQGRWYYVRVNGEAQAAAVNGEDSYCLAPTRLAESTYFEGFAVDRDLRDPWGITPGVGCRGNDCVTVGSAENTLALMDAIVDWQGARMGVSIAPPPQFQGTSGGKFHVRISTALVTSRFPTGNLVYAYASPTHIAMRTSGDLDHRLNVLSHEYFHRIQQGYERAFDAPGPPSAFVEGTAAAVENHTALPIEVLAPHNSFLDPALHPGRRLSAATIGNTGLYSRYLSFLRGPHTNVFNVPYSSAIYWRYFMEQYGLPRDGSPARPTVIPGTSTPTTDSIVTGNPALPLGDDGRSPDEGADLLRHVLDVYASTLGATVLEATDTALVANLGRSLESAMLDMHTAVLLKDYVETDQRWHYEWVGDFEVGADASIFMFTDPPPPPPTKPFPRGTSEYPDGLEPVSRLVSQPIDGTSSFALFGDPRQNVNSFGATYLSFVPDVTLGAFNSSLILETHTGRLRYRVYTIDEAGVPTLHPQCDVLVGEGANATEQCPLVPADGGRERVVINFAFDPAATDVPAEILVVASAGYNGGAFDLAFLSDNEVFVDVIDVQGDPGLQTAPRPVLARFAVREVQDVAGAGGVTPLEVSKGDLCLFTEDSGGVRTEITDFDLAPFIGSAHWATLRLPTSIYPAPGTASTLALVVQYVDSMDANPCGQRRVIAEGTLSAAIRIQANAVTVTPTQLVLDTSLSMGDDDGAKLLALQEAARYFVNSLPDDTPFGMVQFNHDASTAGFGYQPLSTVRTQAHSYIDLLSPGGCTAIGDGLFEAQSNFAAQGYPTNSQMILISDGGQNADYAPLRYIGTNQPGVNTSAGDGTFFDPVGCTTADPDPGDTLPWFSGELRWQSLDSSQRPRVSTLLVGDTGVFSTLLEIAQATNGVFDHVRGTGFSADMMRMSLEISDGMQNENSRDFGLERMRSDKLFQLGELADFDVEGGSAQLRVSMLSLVHSVPGALSLRAPSGATYTPARVNGGAVVFDVPSPEAGTWTWLGAGSQTPTSEPSIFFERAVKSGITMFADADVATVGDVLSGAQSQRFVMRPVYLRVVLSDAAPIGGATVSATVRSPSNAVSTFTLYDDGLNRDGAADDGIYGAVMTNTTDAGTYIVTYTAEGTSGSGPFQRQRTGTYELHDFPDADADGIPDYADVNPNVADAGDDPDSDLLTNWDEFVHGTNPTNPDSDGGGELDGSEVIPLGAGGDPIYAPDDSVRPGLLHVTPCAGRAILTLDSPDHDTALIEHGTSGELGPFSPLTTVSPIPADGLVAIDVANDATHCFRMRSYATGQAQATWSVAQCVYASDDPQAPQLAPRLVSSMFGTTRTRTIRVELNASDPPAGTVSLTEPPLAGCDGNASGVSEMQVSFGDLDSAAWQPYEALTQVTLPSVEQERYLLQMRVRDLAGNVSPIATLWIKLDELELEDVVLYANNSLRIADGARVESSPELEQAAVVNSGTGQTLLSPDAFSPDIFSQSDVTLHARAEVFGSVYTAGVHVPSQDVVVHGKVDEYTILELPPMPPTSIPGGGGEHIIVNSGGSRNLNPGTYGNVTVNSGGTLRFTQAGTYVFQSLKIQSSSTIVALVGSPLLQVRGTLEFRSSIRRSAGGALVFTDIESDTSGQIVIEAPFSGTLLAPDASVRIGTSSAAFNSGSFFARNLEVQAHTTVVHADSVPPSCNDGEANGVETDVDCGGPGTCPRCGGGKLCDAPTDCQSGLCSGGTCQSAVSGSLDVYTDWGTGYCARISVTNNAPTATTHWNATVHFGGSWLSQVWSGVFSSGWGQSTLTPNPGQRIIAPGATSSAVVFCANRWGGGTASLVNVSATY